MTKLLLTAYTAKLARGTVDLDSFAGIPSHQSAQLMVDASRDTVDWEDGDDEAVAQAEIEKTIAGGYGEFLGWASFSIVRERQPVAQIALSNLDEVPTILFVYTAKAHQNQGLAETLIRAAAFELHERGFDQIQLFVTDTNPARALYERLGFELC